MKLKEAANLFEKMGVAGYNKPKKTPSHPTKSHVVVAKEGDKVKTIRFGQQGVSGSPAKKTNQQQIRLGVSHSRLAILPILLKENYLLRIGRTKLNGD